MLQAENCRLADGGSSADVERQKASIVMKDKYLRELLKLEKRKDAEINELKKSMGAAEKEGFKRGFKEAEEAYVKQCDAAKELFFKSGLRAAVERLGHDQQTEVCNPPEYFIPKSLAGYADVMQQQFLEGSDTDEDSSSEDTPVENVDQIDRPESRVEDLTIEQPNETVAPVDTPIVTEGVLPPETGLPAVTDAAFDAEIEDLFA